jgi:hypothetical protein
MIMHTHLSLCVGVGRDLKALPVHVPVISLQNGVHNADVLQQLLPNHTVLPV